ncbi:MAG: hypothetical protein ACQEP8_05440 [Chlamydiota bacterium]
MNKHPFVLEEGVWLGEGTISFNLMPEELKYYMRWTFSNDDGQQASLQEIEIEGGAETIKNSYRYYDIGQEKFALSLENDSIGKVEGQGVFSDKEVGWEFRQNPEIIEGYESYQLQEDGTYIMKAEYMSVDQVRTLIKGRIWKKMAED